MNRLASLWRLGGNLYVSSVLLALLGIGVAYLVFFQVFPGEPKIAVIDIPFTVISDDSAFAIGAHLDFARRDDSIKAVVIKLTSPGGGTDQLKQSFGSMVRAQRGDRLNLSQEELLSGRIYSGIESVRLGLADAIGDDTDAIAKAASLAGISNYELVDVNTEVSRIFNEKRARINEPLNTGGAFFDPADLVALLNLLNGGEDSAQPLGSQDSATGLPLGQALDRPLLSRANRQNQEDALSGFPLEINGPNVYYLYVGPSHETR